MRCKHAFLAAAAAVVAAVLSFALLGCMPKDAASLVKENERSISRASELTIIDTVALSSLKITLRGTPYGDVTASFSGGDIALKRVVKGKEIDAELTAGGISLKVSPYLANMAINAEAFTDVTIIFRARVREDGLTYYLSATGLDKVIADAKPKLEYKSEAPMPLDNAAAEVINLLIRRPIAGNYPTDGEYDKSAKTYSYKVEDDERINNELTRGLKMLIGIDMEELGGLKDFLTNVFGSSDIESIANDLISYDEFSAKVAVKKGKYGYYFGSVETAIASGAALDAEATARLAAAMGLEELLGTAGASINVRASIKIMSDFSSKAD